MGKFLTFGWLAQYSCGIMLFELQRLWMFDVLVCPLSVTERFLLQPLVGGTVFRRTYCTSLLPPLWISSAVVLNHVSFLTFLSLFLTLLSFVQCPLPAQWLVILGLLLHLTPDSLLLTHGLSPTIGQRGGRYDPQPVTRSTDWLTYLHKSHTPATA